MNRVPAIEVYGILLKIFAANAATLLLDFFFDQRDGQDFVLFVRAFSQLVHHFLVFRYRLWSASKKPSSFLFICVVGNKDFDHIDVSLLTRYMERRAAFVGEIRVYSVVATKHPVKGTYVAPLAGV